MSSYVCKCGQRVWLAMFEVEDDMFRQERRIVEFLLCPNCKNREHRRTRKVYDL